MRLHRYSGLFLCGNAALFALALGACSGDNGEPGAAGSSCTVTNNTDGTATITCADGTTATVKPGTPGAPGDPGEAGVPGDPGEAGVPGPAGEAGTSCSVVDNGNGTRTITCTDGTKVTVSDAISDYALMSATEKAESDPRLTVTKVEFPTDGRPVVTMKVTDRKGNGIKNLSPLNSKAGIGWRLNVLKLAGGVNGSANDTWVSYLAANATTAPSYYEYPDATGTPAATNGELTDKGDGTYTYRFAKVINVEASAGTKYEADKVHRITVVMYKSGHPFAPVNTAYDVLPSTGVDMTGKNEKVDPASCAECHGSFRAPAGGTGRFHGGTFHDVRICVACHNDQKRFSSTGTLVTEPAMTASTTLGATWTGKASVINGEAVINIPVYIHKIHMGEHLTLHGGEYAGVKAMYETTYPQDIRNCTKCHRGVDKADNWKAQPSRRACGACHDGTSFLDSAPAGRAAHVGGSATNDTGCATCHAGTAAYSVEKTHKAVAKPEIITTGTMTSGNQLNSSGAWVGCTTAAACTCSTTAPCILNTRATIWNAAAGGYLPTGAAKITWDVKEVLIDATTRNPKIVFKFKKDGTDVDFGTYAAGTKTELMTDFVGSPSAYFAYSIPQDGITAPADFNASASAWIKAVWNGTATGSSVGTLTRDTTTGYYTLTLTGVTIPTGAAMLTGGIGYTYGVATPPLVQTNVTGYSYSATTGIGGLLVPVPNVWKAATDFTARRTMVDNAKCNACHGVLGVNPSFHSGQRNDGPTCSFCHTTNRANTGWIVNASNFVHAIHAAAKRTNEFRWYEKLDGVGIKAWEATYPGNLANCEACHVPGGYDFSSTAAKAQLPNLLWSTSASGSYATNPRTPPPWVSKTVNYGQAFSTSNQTSGTRTTGTQGGVACTPTAPCTCTSTAPCVCSLTAPCDAEGTTLVTSPITTACSSCHDSPIALTHMKDNGGSFYEPRSTAMANKEACLMCHGPGKVAAIATVHK
ncbi:MAG: OmcA/MtrC family decaheme c-type cytochrome [Deltaproteobacteria bacterium]|nr:OmcA/MtrC family decaheme c-type cytochrome [Deltaproteobacteria bacterium]